MAKQTESEKKPIIAYAGLGILSLGILIYSITISTNRITNFAYLLGSNLVSGLVLYAVYSYLLRRHLSAMQKVISFSAILSSLMIGSYVAADRLTQQENQTITRMQENIQRVLESVDSNDGRIDSVETDSTAIQSQDEIIVIEAWFNSYLNDSIANRNNYITELEAVNYFGLLNGAKIRADSNLTESLYILNRTREIIDKYEQLGYESIYSARDKIQTLNISESAKTDVLGGLNRNLQRGLDNIQEISNLDRRVVSEMENLLIFLKSTDTNWTWEDDQFVFTNTKNLDIFDSYLSNIQEAVDAQTQIQESSSQDVENNFQQNLN